MRRRKSCDEVEVIRTRLKSSIEAACCEVSEEVEKAKAKMLARVEDHHVAWQAELDTRMRALLTSGTLSTSQSPNTGKSTFGPVHFLPNVPLTGVVNLLGSLCTVGSTILLRTLPDLALTLVSRFGTLQPDHEVVLKISRSSTLVPLSTLQKALKIEIIKRDTRGQGKTLHRDCKQDEVLKVSAKTEVKTLDGGSPHILVSFLPLQPGLYRASVVLAGSHLKGSPLDLTVLRSVAEAEVLAKLGLKREMVDAVEMEAKEATVKAIEKVMEVAPNVEMNEVAKLKALLENELKPKIDKAVNNVVANIMLRKEAEALKVKKDEQIDVEDIGRLKNKLSVELERCEKVESKNAPADVGVIMVKTLINVEKKKAVLRVLKEPIDEKTDKLLKEKMVKVEWKSLQEDDREPCQAVVEPRGRGRGRGLQTSTPLRPRPVGAAPRNIFQSALSSTLEDNRRRNESLSYLTQTKREGQLGLNNAGVKKVFTEARDSPKTGPVVVKLVGNGDEAKKGSSVAVEEVKDLSVRKEKSGTIRKRGSTSDEEAPPRVQSIKYEDVELKMKREKTIKKFPTDETETNGRVWTEGDHCMARPRDNYGWRHATVTKDIGKGYYRVVFGESGCLGVVKNTVMMELDVEQKRDELVKKQKREELKKREELSKNELKMNEELQKRIETRLLLEKARVQKEKEFGVQKAYEESIKRAEKVNEDYWRKVEDEKRKEEASKRRNEELQKANRSRQDSGRSHALPPAPQRPLLQGYGTPVDKRGSLLVRQVQDLKVDLSIILDLEKMIAAGNCIDAKAQKMLDGKEKKQAELEELSKLAGSVL